jgi:transposase
LLIPNVKRTWAPKRQTPVVHQQIRNGKFSAINALAVSPKRKRIALYLRFRRGSLRGHAIREFLEALMKQVRGLIILLWDRNPIHRQSEVQAFIASHPRLHAEYFLGYAPELNPTEYLWAQAHSALAHSAPGDLTELKTLLNASRRRLRKSQQLLWACIYASGLPWTR